MSAVVTDIFPSVRPLWALEERILHHKATGERLEGLKYDAFGTIEIKGISDLPLLQPIGLTEREDMSVGGGASPMAVGNVPRVDVYEVRYLLQVDKKNGLFRTDPVTNTSTKKMGLAEWSARIRDALETNTSGTVDALLGGMVVKPMTFTVEDSGAEQIAWTAVLVVTLWTRLYFPGNRACLSTDGWAITDESGNPITDEA